MKELGNLAVVCANRKNTLLQILNGNVTVHVGCGPDKKTFTADWHDNNKIHEFIMELNHGQFKEFA